MPLLLVQQVHVTTMGNNSASVGIMHQFIRIANQAKHPFVSTVRNVDRMASKCDDGAHMLQFRQYRIQYVSSCRMSNDSIRLERNYLLANTVGDVANHSHS